MKKIIPFKTEFQSKAFENAIEEYMKTGWQCGRIEPNSSIVYFHDASHNVLSLNINECEIETLTTQYGKVLESLLNANIEFVAYPNMTVDNGGLDNCRILEINVKPLYS